MRLNSPIKSVVLAVDGRGLTAARPLLRGFSTADAWSEVFDANACSSWSAFCFLTSFSTACVHLVFTPMNNSRRSMRLQAEHKNVWCSNPGSVVGSAVDQNRQALLEIYCAVVLGTPYNDFGTH
jgi:hypothetical protein